MEFVMGYSKALVATIKQRLNLCVLPILSQARCEHVTQGIGLVHVNALHTVIQRQTSKGQYIYFLTMYIFIVYIFPSFV